MQNLLYTFFLSLFFVSCVHSQNLNITCPHKTIPFQVQLAQTASEQQKGLMYRTSLGENEGMLFLYSQPQPVAMWMKNTLIPLDMIFCDKEGQILSIHENAKPLSLETIGPIQQTSQVLEIKGGRVEKEGITKNCTLTLNR